MWYPFTDCLTQSINHHEMKSRNPSIPEWFNKRAMKIRHKQRKAYHKSKSSSNDFDLNRYKQTRRSDKKGARSQSGILYK